MDLISNPSYTSSWTCNISLDLYKLSCLWNYILIFVFSYTFCCKSIAVTLFARFPHPFGSTSKSTTFIDNFLLILVHFIILLINVSQGSITDANNVLYLVSHSFILCILDMVYYIISRVWHFFIYYIFFFIMWNCNLIYLSLQLLNHHTIHVCCAILPVFFQNFFCHKFKSL